jgi:hypothetical protein
VPQAIDDALISLREQLTALEHSVAILRTEGRWEPVPTPDPGAWAALPISPAPAPHLAAVPPPATYDPPAEERGKEPPPAPGTRIEEVALIDVGPFTGLSDLRHFEDELAVVGPIDRVRVRRYGKGRAEIELGLLGPCDLALELALTGRPMAVGGEAAAPSMRVELVAPIEVP